MDEELNATQRTLARLNNKNVDPELVAVVQYNETDDTTVLLLNNQEVTDGEGVVYKGKKFPVQLDLLTLGDVPDEVDYQTVVGYKSTEVFSKVYGTKVTTSVPVFGVKPGRTVYGARILLAIGGVSLTLPDQGSRVVCTGATYRRWSVTVPNALWE